MRKDTHNYKKDIIKVIKRLVEDYPKQSLSSHLGIALYEYPNFDSLTDKELYFALSRYECEKELDIHPSVTDIDNIIKDGQDLENILNEDFDDEF